MSSIRTRLIYVCHKLLFSDPVFDLPWSGSTFSLINSKSMQEKGLYILYFRHACNHVWSWILTLHNFIRSKLTMMGLSVWKKKDVQLNFWGIWKKVTKQIIIGEYSYSFKNRNTFPLSCVLGKVWWNRYKGIALQQVRYCAPEHWYNSCIPFPSIHILFLPSVPTYCCRSDTLNGKK